MRIVKCRFGHRADFERIPGFVYCGRCFGGFEASPLANPFSGRGDTIVGVLSRYEEFLAERIRYADPAVLGALASLFEDSVLGCWCVNKEVAGVGEDVCHCDIIAKAWRELT